MVPESRRLSRALLRLGVLAVLLAAPVVFAQSPWEKSSTALMIAFTGPIARGLSLVAIVIGGVSYAYGEGQGKKTIAACVIGVGMASGAVAWYSWLF